MSAGGRATPVARVARRAGRAGLHRPRPSRRPPVGPTSLRSDGPAATDGARQDDRLFAARADGDDRDRHLGEVLEERDVVARLLGQLLEGAAVAQVGLPAGQLLVDRLGVVEDGLVTRQLVVDARPSYS